MDALILLIVVVGGFLTIIFVAFLAVLWSMKDGNY